MQPVAPRYWIEIAGRPVTGEEYLNSLYMDCDEYRLSDIAGRELGDILGIALEDWIDGKSTVEVSDVSDTA
jgi:hypothetical protein